MDRLYDSSWRGGGMDDDGGWKRGGQKFLAGLKAVPFSVFHPVLNYRAGRLRLPRGTILIRKLAESLRSIGTIRWRRGGGLVRGGQVEISETLESRGDGEANICLDAKMSTFSWRKDEFATGYRDDEEEMGNLGDWFTDTFNNVAKFLT